MLEVVVTREVDHPPEKVWGLLANFGNVSWMNGVAKVELDGDGVGMVRNIFVSPDASPVKERMTSLDDDARRLEYVIDEGNPMPVDNYQAFVAVHENGSGSRIEWGANFAAKGTDDATAEAMLEGMYGVLIDWVVAGLES